MPDYSTLLSTTSFDSKHTEFFKLPLVYCIRNNINQYTSSIFKVSHICISGTLISPKMSLNHRLKHVLQSNTQCWTLYPSTFVLVHLLELCSWHLYPISALYLNDCYISILAVFLAILFICFKIGHFYQKLNAHHSFSNYIFYRLLFIFHI